jgi:hypothetical protein
MRKTYFYILIPFLLFSCVSQTKYDELLEENKQLKEENGIQSTRIMMFEVKVEELEEEKRNVQIEKTKIKWYSDEQALGYVKDYYEFYNSDNRFRNVKIRRVTDNQFRVSLEECTKKAEFSNDDFFWNARVYRLTIDNKGNYDMN